MFKLKPGNVFQKINTMDKKQAYTWAAVVVVCLIALITLASFLGDAEDTSFDGFNTRGYDLAQMPFVNDEAEEYLLASKYPDMQNNGAAKLYSQEEKEARQEADAEKSAADGEDADSDSDAAASSSGGYASRGYSGRGGGAGGGSPTQVGSLGSASMGHAGGSGVNSTFGAPRGDFSPYKSQEKGSEIQYQLKNSDARKALSQFARGSSAAAGMMNGKGGNAKKALMGGNIKGSNAFTETGVDLSKAGGLALDTNAPTSSADLSNLEKNVGDGANNAKDDKDDFNNDLQETFWDKLMQQLVSGIVEGLTSSFNEWLGGQVDQWQANKAGRSAFNAELTKGADELYSKPWDKMSAQERQQMKDMLGIKGDFNPDGNLTGGELWKTNKAGGNNTTTNSGGNNTSKTSSGADCGASGGTSDDSSQTQPKEDGNNSNNNTSRRQQRQQARAEKRNLNDFRDECDDWYNSHTNSNVYQAAADARDEAYYSRSGNRGSSSKNNNCKKCEDIKDKTSSAYGTCIATCGK